MPVPGSFADTLAGALDGAGSPACVGLDPVVERLPAELRSAHGTDAPGAIGAFSDGVVDAVARAGVAAVKFQSACYERFGAPGIGVLARSMARARQRGLVVILDGKRGDIGISATHYASAAFDTLGADAITVSPYLGADTLEPFLRPGRGLFVLVRTSNPGSDAFQGALLADGRTVAECTADMVRALGVPRVGTHGLSDVGAVVGATKRQDGAALRTRMPEQWVLVPGFGAQGGTVDDCRALVREDARTPGTAGVLVTASRSVIYPESPGAGDWAGAVESCARAFAREVRGVITGAV